MPSALEYLVKNFAATDVQQGPRVLTVKAAAPEQMPVDQKTGKQETKLRLTFLEDARGLILNRERGTFMVTAFGEDYSKWIGAKVELFFDPTARGFAGARGGIGLRKPGK